MGLLNGLALWVALSVPLALLAGRLLHAANPALVSEIEDFLRRRRPDPFRRAVTVLSVAFVVGGVVLGTSEVAQRMPVTTVVTDRATELESSSTVSLTDASPKAGVRRSPAGVPPSETDEPVEIGEAAATTTTFVVEASQDSSWWSHPTFSRDDSDEDEEHFVVPDAGGGRPSDRDDDPPASTTTTTEPDAEPEPTITTTTTTEPEPTTTTTTEPEPTTTTTTTAPPPEETTSGEGDGGGN